MGAGLRVVVPPTIGEPAIGVTPIIMPPAPVKLDARLKKPGPHDQARYAHHTFTHSHTKNIAGRLGDQKLQHVARKAAGVRGVMWRLVSNVGEKRRG